MAYRRLAPFDDGDVVGDIDEASSKPMLAPSRRPSSGSTSGDDGEPDLLLRRPTAPTPSVAGGSRGGRGALAPSHAPTAAPSTTAATRASDDGDDERLGGGGGGRRRLRQTAVADDAAATILLTPAPSSAPTAQATTLYYDTRAEYIGMDPVYCAPSSSDGGDVCSIKVGDVYMYPMITHECGAAACACRGTTSGFASPAADVDDHCSDFTFAVVYVGVLFSRAGCFCVNVTVNHRAAGENKTCFLPVFIYI